MAKPSPESESLVPQSTSNGRQAVYRLLSNRKAVAGAVVLGVLVLAALFADVITVYDPTEMNLRGRLQAPSADHWLGTDNFGRDVLTRIVYGGRISLQVGFISVGIALACGGFMGLVAGFYEGLADNLLMRVVDVLLAIPGFLLALAIAGALGPSLKNVMIAVGVSYVPHFARVMRSAVIQAREMDYVSAALAAGASHARVMFKHVVPNSLSPVIVQATLAMAGAILSAAGLSFLGLGAQPPTPEWGAMLSQARSFIRVAHHAVTFPGLAIVMTVLALNMVGDGLRDAFDPRMKR